MMILIGICSEFTLEQQGRKILKDVGKSEKGVN